MEAYKPLKGVKVVELSLQVAASSCGRLMADWGADVIKVENTGIGDPFRKWPKAVSSPNEDEYNPHFDTLNANKRGLSVNLKTEAGQELMHKLLASADVFLTNNRTGALKNLGLDYDALKVRYPKLVMAQIDGYGEAGPEADRPGYDNTAFWARCGFMYGQGVYDEGENHTYPVYMPMGFGDSACSFALMAAIVSALYAARETGKGDRVHVSLYGTAVYLANVMINSAQFGYKYPRSRESCSPFGAPYKCRDGRWFMPQIVNVDRDHDEFYEMMGCHDYVGNPRYADRGKFNDIELNREVLERFEKIFAEKTAKEWYDLFMEHDFSCEILARYAEIPYDEQALANNMFYDMQYSNGKTSRLPRGPLLSDNMGLPEYRKGPMLGEHTVEIMKEYGYSEDEIKTMLSEGSVKQHD